MPVFFLRTSESRPSLCGKYFNIPLHTFFFHFYLRMDSSAMPTVVGYEKREAGFCYHWHSLHAPVCAKSCADYFSKPCSSHEMRFICVHSIPFVAIFSVPRPPCSTNPYPPLLMLKNTTPNTSAGLFVLDVDLRFQRVLKKCVGRRGLLRMMLFESPCSTWVILKVSYRYT